MVCVLFVQNILLLALMSLLHVCLYVCLCVHDTAEPLDGVHELPDTQTAQQTDVNETYIGMRGN